jgi:hypothetical protein
MAGYRIIHDQPNFCLAMIALRNPTRRIYFAIAFSAMIHAAILWLPQIQFPHERVHLPPLTVRLEHLPLPVDKPAAKPEPLSQLSKPGDGPSTKKISRVANSMKEMEKSASTRLFPKHVQLTFDVYKGADLSKVGELHHQLDIDRDRYTLKASQQTTGLSSLANDDQFNQTSHGKIDEHGLQPETFEEKKITGGSKQGLKATFDWASQKLRFSQSGDTELPTGTQDILSFMYQLSQLSIPSMRVEFFPLPISDGTQLAQHQIEIGRAEDISTPMGKLRALHLRKMHAQGEAYFEIWLGLEYRLLPVKFRMVNALDKVTEEYVISDILAADE